MSEFQGALSVRDGRIYVPTMGVTTEGWHLHINPVRVIDATDYPLVQITLRQDYVVGNTPIPHPSDTRKLPKWVVLKAAGVKSAKEFHQTSLDIMYGEFEDYWQLVYGPPGTSEEGKVIRDLRPGSIDEVIALVVSLIRKYR